MNFAKCRTFKFPVSLEYRRCEQSKKCVQWVSDWRLARALTRTGRASPRTCAHTHTTTTCPRSSGREHLRQPACSQTSRLQEKKKKKQEGKKAWRQKAGRAPVSRCRPAEIQGSRFDRGEEAGGGLQVSRPQKIPQQRSSFNPGRSNAACASFVHRL